MIGCGQNVSVLYWSVGLGWDRSEEVGTAYLNWVICKGINPNLVQTFTLLILVLHIYMNIDY